MPEVNDIDPIFSPFRTSKYPGFQSAASSSGPSGGGGAGSTAPVPITASFRPRPDDDPRDPNADRTGNPSTDRVSRRSAPPGKNPGLERDLATQGAIDAGLEKVAEQVPGAVVDMTLTGLGLGAPKKAYDLAKMAYDHFTGSDDGETGTSTASTDPVGSTGATNTAGNNGGSRGAADRIGRGGNVSGAGSENGPPGSPNNEGNGPGGSGPSGGGVGGEKGDGGSSFHDGGYVAGDMDMQPREDVPATLQEQEFVLHADLTQAIGATNLEALNRGIVDPAVIRQAIQADLARKQQAQPQADPMSLRG